MYAALWRHLPGGRLVKSLQSLVLLAAVVAFCFLWLFPRIADRMPFADVTVEQTTSSPAAPTSGTAGSSTPAPSRSATPSPSGATP